MIKQLKQYTTFISEEGQLVIVIPFVRGSLPISPKILYDGGEHALFQRNSTQSLILDYLNEAAQIVLKQGGEVLVFEVEPEHDQISFSYSAPLLLTALPPFELEETRNKN